MSPITLTVTIAIAIASVLFYLSCINWVLNKDVPEEILKYKAYGNIHNTPIVIVPGLDGITAFFADVIPELTPHYYVIMFHLPLKSKNNNGSYSFEYISNELHELTVELNLLRPVVLIGESFGGVVVQHFALMFPEKVSSLVVLSSLAKTIIPQEVELKVRYVLPILKVIGEVFPRPAQWLFANFHVDDVVAKSDPKFVRDLFIKEASWAHFPSVIARIQIIYNLDIKDKVKSITKPVLVVYGEDDHFTKALSFDLHSLLPNSQLTSLPGGHLPHIVHPKKFSDIVISFITSCNLS